jgi:hypothetical protein
MSGSPAPTTASNLVDLGAATDSGSGPPNVALIYVLLVGLACAAWLLVKALARRDIGWADRLYDRADPLAQAVRIWTSTAPATFVYLAVWTGTTMVAQGTPTALNDVMTRFNSTNVVGLIAEPVKSLVVSALLVADSGLFFIGYVAAYVLIVARLEHRLGAARTIMIWIAAHVGGSVLIVSLEAILIKANIASDKLALTTDVGVSYVMVGSLGAYLLLVSRKWRWWYAAALAGGTVGPLVVSQQIWDLGHFLATVLGIAAGAVALRIGPTRPPVWWREICRRPVRPIQFKRTSRRANDPRSV